MDGEKEKDLMKKKSKEQLDSGGNRSKHSIGNKEKDEVLAIRK